jgi:hypothetical protein
LKTVLTKVEYTQCKLCGSFLIGKEKEKGICTECSNYGDYSYVYHEPTINYKKGKPLFKNWEIFKYSDKDLYDILQIKLKQIFKKVIGKKYEYLYAVGDIPIMMVAHIDTVHSKLPRIEHDHGENILWAINGLGADDRAGVIGIINILNSGYRPHVLFCNYEEVGGKGAKIAANKLKPKNLKYIIELDRRNSNDAVFYDCDNDKFEKYITSFGFKHSWGSFSDISILCPKWGVAGVNLSTGYYNAHNKNEYLKIDEWKEIIGKVKKMLDNPPDNSFKYITKTTYYGKITDDKKKKIETEIAMNILFYKSKLDIQDIIDLFGGTYLQWYDYLKEHESILMDLLDDGVYNCVDELVTSYPPKFLFE